jgi:hypothetical protein
MPTVHLIYEPCVIERTEAAPLAVMVANVFRRTRVERAGQSMRATSRVSPSPRDLSARGSISRSISHARLPRRCSAHASRRGYCPSERPATFPRAVGNGRTAWLVTGTGSHSLSGLGNAGSSALQFALHGGCSSDFARSPPPGRPTTLTIACPPALTWMCSTLEQSGHPLFCGAVHIISHGRYVAFQMAKVAIPRHLFADILRLIAELRPPPAAVST